MVLDSRTRIQVHNPLVPDLHNVHSAVKEFITCDYQVLANNDIKLIPLGSEVTIQSLQLPRYDSGRDRLQNSTSTYTLHNVTRRLGPSRRLSELCCYVMSQILALDPYASHMIRTRSRIADSSSTLSFPALEISQQRTVIAFDELLQASHLFL